VKASLWTAAVYALLASSFASVAFGASVGTSADCGPDTSPGSNPNPGPGGSCVIGTYPTFRVSGPQLPAAVGADITVRVSGTAHILLNFPYGLGGNPGMPGMSNPPSTLTGSGGVNINYAWAALAPPLPSPEFPIAISTISNPLIFSGGGTASQASYSASFPAESARTISYQDAVAFGLVGTGMGFLSGNGSLSYAIPSVPPAICDPLNPFCTTGSSFFMGAFSISDAPLSVVPVPGTLVLVALGLGALGVIGAGAPRTRLEVLPG
jgi:hypothetical protein